MNSAPTLAPAEFEVLHDTALAVPAAQGALAGAVGADGDTVTVALASGVRHGNLGY